MLHVELPPPLDSLVCTLTSFLDDRHAELLEPLFLGALLAHGRRTATAWFRAAGIGNAFRRAYTLLGTLGRGKVNTFAALLWDRQRCTIDPARTGCWPSTTRRRRATARASRAPASTTTPPPAPPAAPSCTATTG